METLVWQCELCPAGLTEGGEGLQGQRLSGWKGWNTVLPEVWESLGTALLSTASDLCPVFNCSKTVPNLLPLPNTSCHRGSDVANPMAGKALGGGDSPRLQRGRGGAAGKEDTATRSLPELTAAGTADPRRHGGQSPLRGAPPRSRGAGRGQELERNHVRRLPPSLGPGGPGRLLGRQGEPGRPSRTAEAVLRGCSRNSLELPP